MHHGGAVAGGQQVRGRLAGRLARPSGLGQSRHRLTPPVAVPGDGGRREARASRREVGGGGQHGPRGDAGRHVVIGIGMLEGLKQVADRLVEPGGLEGGLAGPQRRLESGPGQWPGREQSLEVSGRQKPLGLRRLEESVSLQQDRIGPQRRQNPPPDAGEGVGILAADRDQPGAEVLEQVLELPDRLPGVVRRLLDCPPHQVEGPGRVVDVHRRGHRLSEGGPRPRDAAE